MLGHTWFLFALFEMFILAFFFQKLLKYKSLWIPIFLCLAVVNCFGVSERFLAIGDLMKNGVFFWSGMLLALLPSEKIYCLGKEKHLFLALLFITVAGTIIWMLRREFLINILVFGLAIIVLFGVIQIRFSIRGKIIDFISHYSFAIYILHWPVMMVIRLVFYQLLHFNSVLVVFLMFFGGLLIPLALIWICRQFNEPLLKRLCKVVLGM